MAEPEAKPPANPGGSPRKKWNKRNKRHGNKPTVQPTKFQGGKEELAGNYFDCTGYGQSDRFVKTVAKIADLVGQDYKSGGTTRTEVMTQTNVVIPVPVRPQATTVYAADGVTVAGQSPPDALDISDYQSAKKLYDYQTLNQTENRQKVFSLVWQQCTESMHAKIKANKDYQVIEQTLDGIDLLRIIKLICFNIEDEKYAPQKVHEVKSAFYGLKQGRDTDQVYQTKFLNTVQVIEQCGASLGEDPMTREVVCKALGFSVDTSDATQMVQITKTVRDYTLGTALILGADPDRYSNMIRGLKNASLAGRDEWPKNVTEAYNYLSKWEGEDNTGQRPRDYEGVAFGIDGDTGKTSGPQPWHAKMTCRNCNKKGHIASFCENKVADANVQEGEVDEEATQQLLDSIQNVDTDYEADLFACDSFLSENEENRSVSFQMKDGINGGRIPKRWVLLDSQSTADAFSNPDLLTNIHEVKGSLTIHTQAGKAVTKLRGTVPGYGEVWYCPEGIANILSLANVSKTRSIKFDSTSGNQFEVTKNDGTKRIFKQSQHGLYYHDMGIPKSSARQGHGLSSGVCSTSLLNTVSENKAKYTVSDYQRAEKARTIQRRIGRPSTKRYLELASKGRIMNCDVTRQDILNAEHIFGPDIGSIKGKTVRQASDQVRSGGLVPIPATIMDHYRKVVLCVDVMKVNKMPFLVTISRAIKFGTVAWLKNAKITTILSAIKDVRNIYMKRGFSLEIVEVDGQFEPLRGELAPMGITLNKCSREEHVPVVERRIRTLKERCRCIHNTLPFKRMPGMLVVQMVSTCNFWLNIYPPKDGVSRSINPRELLTGTKIDYNKHIRAEFGEYVQVHEEHDNSMQSRTTGAIATKPTGNVQGGHWFYSLTTGRMLDRQKWTPLPMPAEVIERINVLAKTGQVGMNFTNMRNEEYDDDLDDASEGDDDSDSDDSDYDDEDDDSSDGDDDDYDDFIAGVNGNNVAPLDPPTDDDQDQDEEQSVEDGDENNENDNELADDDNDNDDELVDDDNDDEIVNPALKKLTDYYGVMPPVIESRTRSQAKETGENLLIGVSSKTSDEDGFTVSINKKQRKFRRKLEIQLLKRREEEIKKKLKNKKQNEKRKSKLKNKKEQFGDLRDQLKSRQKPGVLFPDDTCSPKGLTADLEAIALTQYTLKRGLKEFGEDGLIALGKEVGQLHERKVAKPVDGSKLTREQKRASLRYLMFLTKKRCGRIKARGCADGRKQRATTTKEEASAPTVAIESVMLSATIDAMEKRDVATVDIPGAFMQADIDEVVHIKFEGEIAEMLVKMDPKLYRKYIKDEHGKPVLYVELLKALYGTMRAALLFWKLLSSKLVLWGFEINPYDWCVANKMIDGKQCTILWHVDDLKISHVDAEVVTGIIELIKEEFGKEAPLTVTRGKVHDYLGMTLDYSEEGKVKIKMLDYVEKMLADLPKEMDGEAITPAANHLFDVDEDSPKMGEEQAQFYHTYVAKTLFLCKRARPDLQPTVAFLSTRIQSCNEDDYKKLVRMLQFLRATKSDYLTLSAESLHNVRWWVDASYAVHPDMKSHTGGCMSLGRGVIYGTSRKHRLNTKSSTESELVSVDDVLPQILWTLYFLEAQGYKIDDNILYQDNKSSILLETNGRGSSGKRTRHINVRYFFIADRVKSKEVRIEHCPTGIMLADYFTKPQQGKLFRQMRDMIMGNIDIALPTDSVSFSASDKASGIPTTTIPLESRSVLGSVISDVTDDDVTDALKSVTGALNEQEAKEASTTATISGSNVSTTGRKPSNDEHSSRVKNTSMEHLRALKVEKRTISWADIARKGNKK